MTLKYPTSVDVVFAYNPNYIELSDAASALTLEVELSNKATEKSFSVTSTVYNGGAKVYISKILQVLCGGERCATITGNYKVNMPTGQMGYIYNNMMFQCIAGCIDIGQRFGQVGLYNYDESEKAFVRRVRWFKNFPFKVSLFVPIVGAGNYDVVARYDGNVYGAGETMTAGGFYDVEPSAKIPDAVNLGVVKLYDTTAASSGTTFDETFDYTFKSLMETDVVVRLKVDNSTAGHYFRWLDNFAQWQYFLFAPGTDEVTIEDGDEIVEDFAQSGFHFADFPRVQSKGRTRAIKCCAQNLTRDEVDYVRTIVSSAYVEMYVHGDLWMPCNIKSGTYSVSEKDNLVDFEITATIPAAQTQTR